LYKTSKQLITGAHPEIMQQLSYELGVRLFPGKEHVLKEPNALGLQIQTYEIFRAVVKGGYTYPLVVETGSLFGELYL
jgi:hypothetical protein